MRRLLGVMLVFLGLSGVVASQSIPAAMAAGPHGTLIEIDGAIQPVTARFLSGSIETATEEGAQLLIVRLDTPGGLFDSTRDMVESILTSRIPIVVYVAPTGSHAASAGTFIAAAAHVAAMAPVTNIGAASPVSGSGQDLPETLKSKATQDAAAFMRDIAKARGRNSEALEETVLSARSYSATEALDNNIIDLIAGDMDDLLAQLDGRTVQLDEGSIVLRTADLEVRSIQPTLLERFLGIIGNPNVAFILLSAATVLVFIEVLAPGLLVPGITGGILLALAFVAMGNLPVNIAGIGLIFLSMALFYLELAVAPGIGFFGVSGLISFVLGALFLFGGYDLPGFSPPPIPTPSFRTSPWLVAGIAAAMSGVFLFVFRGMVAARRSGGAGSTTAPSLVGQLGLATTALDPSGTVRVASEQWSAVSDSGEEIGEGEEVMVVEADGLTLKVFRAPETGDLSEESVP